MHLQGDAAGEDAAAPPGFGDGELDGVYRQPPIMVMPISGLHH